MQQEQINRDTVIEHIEFILDSSIARSSAILRKLGMNTSEGELANELMEGKNDNVSIEQNL